MEAATSGPLQAPQQLELPLSSAPVDRAQQVLDKLFDMAMNDKNLAAAKLFLEYYHSDPDDEPTFSREDVLKLLQEHLSTAA